MSGLVTVFASSSPQTPEAYLAAAAELGHGLAAAGWRVRTGAGREGCMGALADAVLAAGGACQGVILRTFRDQGLQHPALGDVQVADDMRTRKRLLGAGADAFVVLPGGPGTWEELWEVVVERQIGVHDSPVVLVNVAGFYAGFRATLARAAAEGLLYGPPGDLLRIADGPASALEQLADARDRA